MEKHPSRVARAALGVARVTNAPARLLSGRRFFPLWGIVYHRGRRSGRRLAAPVAVRATPAGFIIALPFAEAQWFRNVLAACEGVVRWNRFNARSWPGRASTDLTLRRKAPMSSGAQRRTSSWRRGEPFPAPPCPTVVGNGRTGTIRETSNGS
jgi:hypothetical protein